MKYLFYICIFSPLLFSMNSLAAKLSGEVKSIGKCKKAPHHIWVSQKGQLIYHTKITPNSSFFFNLKPGKYRVAVNTKNDCFASKKFKIKKGKRLKLVVKKIEARQPASPMCMECIRKDILTGRRQMMPLPSFSFPNRPNPWWYQTGAWSYPNIGYPGPVTPNIGPTANIWRGLPPHAYSGGGGVAFGKPQLYYQGKKAKQISIDFKKFHFHLASVPDLTAKKKVKLTSNNKLTVDGISHDYLFYDLRSENHKSQFKYGFCGQRKDVLLKMVAALGKSNFNQKSQDDFLDHWDLQLPRNERICVYPQENKNMDKIAPLGIEGDIIVARLNFVVMTATQCELSKTIDCNKIKPWEQTIIKDAELFEWGVGFLFSNALNDPIAKN